MKMQLFRMAAIIAFITMIGCIAASQLTPERCGTAPTMAQAEWGVNYYVQNVGLKDPSSAQVRNIQIVRPYGQANIHGNIYGWLVTFELNAKNSYGAYVGFRNREIIMINGGKDVWYSKYQLD
jgi:hypothetical protein